MAQQHKIAAARNRRLKGTSDIVLLEHPAAGRSKTSRGRTRRQAPDVDGETLITGLPATAKRGDFIPIIYTGARNLNLTARMA